MISLTIEQICILELLKAALFGVTPEIPEKVNWEEVYELASLQCIVPLISSNVPEKYNSEWLGITCQNKAHFMRLLYEQNSLLSLFRDNGIPFVIFKGTAAAKYYPTPSLRTYGDIDLYVSEENFDLANTLLKNNGYLFVEETYRHFEYSKNGIEIELHNMISSLCYNNIDSIFMNGLNNAEESKIENFSFPCLPSYENGLVLIGHIMQHLKTTGIGLRQIIDWMMFVHKALNDTAWSEHFSFYVREAGLEKLAITVTFMCRKWLGLPDEISWCDGADEEIADQLLIRLFDDGNFGRDRAKTESVKKSIKELGAFKYLQLAGMTHWTLAQKYAVFRPFAWFYQLCRYACKGIAGLFIGNKVFRKGRNRMSLEELWKRLQ